MLFAVWKPDAPPLTRSILAPPEALSTLPGPRPHTGRLRVSGQQVRHQAPPSLPGPGPYLARATPRTSEAWGGILQAQQLLHESLTKLGPAVPLHVIGIRHLVQNVGIIDCDADSKPEHLLPGLIRFMRNEIPKRTEG